MSIDPAATNESVISEPVERIEFLDVEIKSQAQKSRTLKFRWKLGMTCRK